MDVAQIRVGKGRVLSAALNRRHELRANCYDCPEFVTGNRDSEGDIVADTEQLTPSEQRVLEEVKRHGGYVRKADIVEAHIRPHALTRLVERGLLERVRRGLYRSAELITSDTGIADVAAASTHGVICLLSALSHYELTTTTPWEIFLALPRKSIRPPTMAYPSVHVVYYNNAMFGYNVRTEQISGGSRCTHPKRVSRMLSTFKTMSAVTLPSRQSDCTSAGASRTFVRWLKQVRCAESAMQYDRSLRRWFDAAPGQRHGRVGTGQDPNHSPPDGIGLQPAHHAVLPGAATQTHGSDPCLGSGVEIRLLSAAPPCASVNQPRLNRLLLRRPGHPLGGTCAFCNVVVIHGGLRHGVRWWHGFGIGHRILTA